MNRAERRRQERLARKTERVGPGTVTSIPGSYDNGAAGELPPKIPGKHRWVLTCAYAITEDQVYGEMSGDGETYLDHETRIGMALGCIDCEEPFPHITPETTCPADGQ